MILVCAGLCLAAGAAVYVRRAPLDVTALHVMPAPRAAGDYSDVGGFTAIRPALSGPSALETLSDVIANTPRTDLLAESAEMKTFVTRSRIFGFPDITTVWVIHGRGGHEIGIYGRLVYGKSDLGVNKRRIAGWLDEAVGNL